MQNLMAREKNLTDLDCHVCQESSIFVYTVLPYIVISLPANCWVLWLMISSPVFWTDRMEVSEFHLVLTELVFGFLEAPFIITNFLSNTAEVDIMAYLIKMIFTARIQFQSSVCIERYLAVLHPLLYLRFKLLRYRMSFCCVIWLLTIMTVAVLSFWCNEDQISVGIYTISFIYFFIVNSFCCLSVLRALKQPPPGDRKREGSNLIKRRAFSIVLIFQVTTFVGYAPLITMLLLVGKIDQDTMCIWQPLSYYLMIWLGVVHPILYLHRAGKHLVTTNLCVKSFQK